MPAILMSLGPIVGSALLGMMQAMMTKSMIRFVILKMIDYSISRYERSAKKTEDKEDDKRAVMLREFHSKLQNDWK